jgi:hypothetical protein
VQTGQLGEHVGMATGAQVDERLGDLPSRIRNVPSRVIPVITPRAG